MNRLTNLNCPVALACMLVGASTSTAHAYLDPGTGSILLQVLLGGAAGLVLAGKLLAEIGRHTRFQAQIR